MGRCGREGVYFVKAGNFRPKSTEKSSAGGTSCSRNSRRWWGETNRRMLGIRPRWCGGRMIRYRCRRDQAKTPRTFNLKRHRSFSALRANPPRRFTCPSRYKVLCLQFAKFFVGSQRPSVNGGKGVAVTRRKVFAKRGSSFRKGWAESMRWQVALRNAESRLGAAPNQVCSQEQLQGCARND